MPLTSEQAAIFRVTHVDNIAWDLEHGIRCRNSPSVNPRFRNIGNLDLIEKRKHRIVPIPPGGSLSDYVPFYFTPRSPMLYNIKTGYNGIPQVPMADIVMYVGLLRQLASNGVRFVFTDRHAKLEMAEFSSDLADLDRIDWPILQNSDFKHDPTDPGKKDRYQAEALIYRHLPCSSLAWIVCHTEAARSHVTNVAAERGISVPILAKPGMYF